MPKDNLDKEKEILRQGELRVKGILDFSKEIDDKIFKLLASAFTISSGIVFLLLKESKNLEVNVKYSCIFSIVILFFVIIFLLLAGKPARYRGIGLPMIDFKDNKEFKDILISSKARYEARFDHNKSLNKEKNFWLKRALFLLVFLPFVTYFFYLSTFFFPIIIVILVWLALFIIMLCVMLYDFIIKKFKSKFLPRKFII